MDLASHRAEFASSGGAPCRPRVALLGPYASRNLGDTATQMAVIAQLRRRRPDVEIVGISPDPADTGASLGIAAQPLVPRHALRAAWGDLRFVRSLDLLVVSGGGQLDDFWGGAFGHPWALWRWTTLARMAGVPVAFAGVGLDRLRHAMSRRLVLHALEGAAQRVFRDARTREAMQALGLRGASSTCPDLAFALAAPAPPVPTPAHAGRRFAVLNPVSQRTWAADADARQAADLAQIATAAAALASRGLALRIACSQPTMDLPDAEQLERLLRARRVHDVTLCPVRTVSDYLHQVRGADIVVAGRLHGAILALVAGSPVVALAPLPKLRALMAELGLPQLCLDVPGFDAQGLMRCCGEVLADVDAHRAHVAQRLAHWRTRLATVFDDLAALLPAPPLSLAASTSTGNAHA